MWFSNSYFDPICSPQFNCPEYMKAAPNMSLNHYSCGLSFTWKPISKSVHLHVLFVHFVWRRLKVFVGSFGYRVRRFSGFSDNFSHHFNPYLLPFLLLAAGSGGGRSCPGGHRGCASFFPSVSPCSTSYAPGTQNDIKGQLFFV